MFVRQTMHAATRDEIERIADEHIARPEVELVHVTSPRGDGSTWKAEIYAHVSPAHPRTDVLVTRAFVDALAKGLQ